MNKPSLFWKMVDSGKRNQKIERIIYRDICKGAGFMTLKTQIGIKWCLLVFDVAPETEIDALVTLFESPLISNPGN